MRLFHHVTKKTGHILFPYVWHYYTDTYSGRFHHLIVDSVLSLIILSLIAINVAIAGALFLLSIPPQVTVTGSVPTVIISGEPLLLTIQYDNQRKTVANFTGEVITPPGFNATTPTNWQQPQLHQGEQGTIEVGGRFIGQPNAHYRFIILYGFDYYGQHYSTIIPVDFVVAMSSFEVVPEVTGTILNNEEFQWAIHYSNSSALPRQRACITVTLPGAFVLTQSSQPLRDGQRFAFDDLPARATGTITVAGSFHNAIGEGKQVIGVTAMDDCTTTPITQLAVSTPIEVLTPRLQLQASGPTVVNVGAAVTYYQTYTNSGDAVLENVVVTTQLADTAERIQRISSADGSVAGTTISWVNPQLAPGEHRQVSFTVYTNPALREKNAEYSFSSRATATIADVGVVTYAPSIRYATKFNSTLNFVGVERYTATSGEQLGYGPYPLEADTITALRVFWEMRDFTNDLSNVTIQTTLPSQVEWTGLSAVTAGGAMTYDSASRTVTWHTSTVPSFSHAQGGSFEVRLRPNTLQVGKTINVTNETVFSARDSFTGVVLQRTLGALRTDQPIQ
ncbi:MAG: DUF11 domain-containing protein [Candidatus Kerfeldbacteria bacterium]|nr:DUF11 domain-containing protein [Candidatus Kerfeldbacteria bacterium]